MTELTNFFAFVGALVVFVGGVYYYGVYRRKKKAENAKGGPGKPVDRAN